MLSNTPHPHLPPQHPRPHPQHPAPNTHTHPSNPQHPLPSRARTHGK